MVGTVDARLAELGITLAPAMAPAANYVPWVTTGPLLFVSGQVSVGPDGPIRGQLTAADQVEGAVAEGSALARAQGAARQCGLNLLSQAKAAVGDLDRIARVVKLVGFVNSAPDFAQQHLVVNGCSGLMAEVFGEAGAHARSAVGVAALPLGVLVEVEAIFELAPG